MSILARTENEAAVGILLDAVRAHRVVPFVGAGLSMEYGHRGWPDFLAALARESTIEPDIQVMLAAGDFAKSAEALRSDLGRLVFEDRLAEAFGPRATRIPTWTTAAAYLPALCYIPHLQRCGPVITTNFDRVLKRVFDASGQPFEAEVWGARAYSFRRALADNEPFLLKIHGDVLDPTDRVFTLSEYESKYDGGIANLLAYLFSSRSLLFVGCSLDHDRVMELLEEQSSTPYSHFAILEAPADPVDQAFFAARRRFLSNRNIRPIWYDHGQHHQINAFLDHVIASTTTEPHSIDLLLARNSKSPEQVVRMLSVIRAERIPYPPRVEVELARARWSLGLDFMSHGDFHSAVRELEQAVVVLPEEADLHAKFGTALVGRGEFARALDEFAIAERGGMPLLDITMLRVLTYFAQRDFRQIRQQLDLAMELGFDPAGIYEMRSFAYMGSADYPAALADAKRAVALKPNSICAPYIPKLEAMGFKASLVKAALSLVVQGSGGMVSMFIKMGWLGKGSNSVEGILQANPFLPEGIDPPKRPQIES